VKSKQPRPQVRFYASSVLGIGDQFKIQAFCIACHTSYYGRLSILHYNCNEPKLNKACREAELEHPKSLTHKTRIYRYLFMIGQSFATSDLSILLSDLRHFPFAITQMMNWKCNYVGEICKILYTMLCVAWNWIQLDTGYRRSYDLARFLAYAIINVEELEQWVSSILIQFNLRMVVHINQYINHSQTLDILLWLFPLPRYIEYECSMYLSS